MNTKNIKRIIADGGKIQPGVYIATATDMIEDQKSWDDEDKSKNSDFTTSPYWITTDDGIDPKGIDSDKELAETCPDYENA